VAKKLFFPWLFLLIIDCTFLQYVNEATSQLKLQQNVDFLCDFVVVVVVVAVFVAVAAAVAFFGDVVVGVTLLRMI